MTLQHIVLFAFAAELDDQDAAEMRAQIEDWPDRIGGFEAIRFGRDITGARTRGHQYLLYTEFQDEPALVAYQQHPLHQHFLKWVLDHDCTPLAFDFELNQDTVIWPRLAPTPPEDKS
jgi:heme-degrading monooxygenase HmoA